MAGYSRLVVYGLPAAEAPRRVQGSPVTVQGSPAWDAFLRERRQLDDGRLTLLLSLRRLEAEERLLVVDWGTAYANAFLLIEPLDDGFDLVEASTAGAAQVMVAAQAVADGAGSSTLLGLLRAAYGRWVYWTSSTETSRRCCFRDLPLTVAGETLLSRLQEALPRAYPPALVRSQIVRLLQDESELFAGRNVERARSPFLTRLGLAVVYDPSLLTETLRGLVNEGRVSAHAPDGRYHLSGPTAPVPEGMPNELFERMLL